MVTAGVVSLVHVPVCYLFVRYIGFRGAAFAVVVSQWLMAAVVVAVVLVRERCSSNPIGDTWPSLVWRDVFSWPGAKQYLRFSLPAAGSLFVEWGGYEVYAAMTAQLGPVALATHSVMNVQTALWYLLACQLNPALLLSLSLFLCLFFLFLSLFSLLLSSLSLSHLSCLSRNTMRVFLLQHETAIQVPLPP
jgi:Na+-driven multidrug efflux pump